MDTAEKRKQIENTIKAFTEAFELAYDVVTVVNTKLGYCYNVAVDEGKSCDGLPEGDFNSAYEYMCREKIDPRDVHKAEVSKPENLFKYVMDKDNMSPVKFRYRAKNNPKVWMEQSILKLEQYPETVFLFEKEVIPENRKRDMGNIIKFVENKYVMIFSSNLTQNECHVVGNWENMLISINRNTTFDELIRCEAETIHNDFYEDFINKFSRDALIKAYNEGAESVWMEHLQRYNDDKHHWTMTKMVFIKEQKDNDIHVLVFVMRIDRDGELKKERDRANAQILNIGRRMFKMYVSIDLDADIYKMYRFNAENEKVGMVTGKYTKFFDRLRGKIPTPYIDHLSSEISTEKLKAYIEKGEMKTKLFSCPVIEDDGTEEYVEIYVFMMNDYGKNGVLMVVRDVTDQVKREKTIQSVKNEKDNILALRNLNKDLIEVLATLVEYRALESGEHIKRIKGYTCLLARKVMREYPKYGLNEDKINLIVAASAMHDIGKIAIPDSILLKPGRFTREEFDIMREHSEKGSEIIKMISNVQGVEYASYCYDITRYHHERWDGKGYPDGLKCEDIPISAQIVSIADVYDALISERCYKEAYSTETAYEMIKGGQCGIFNPKILHCFDLARKEFEELAKQDITETETEIRESGKNIHITGKRILVVGHDEMCLDILCAIIEELGAELVSARSGTEAVRLVKDSIEGYFDMIFIDVNMPDMDGYTATRQIRLMDRTDVKKMPVLAVMSCTDEYDNKKFTDCGINAFIQKPVDTRQLYMCMVDYLG
ncbi:MAG: HD domain-containing protein [Bacillota bacterium]|nr:HD domain-containing protein [Bacillota bacterium]